MPTETHTMNNEILPLEAITARLTNTWEVKKGRPQKCVISFSNPGNRPAFPLNSTKHTNPPSAIPRFPGFTPLPHSAKNTAARALLCPFSGLLAPPARTPSAGVIV
jgi:hypothetical protein